MPKNIKPEDLEILSALFLSKAGEIQVQDPTDQFLGFAPSSNTQSELLQLILAKNAQLEKSTVSYDNILEFGNSNKNLCVNKIEMRYIFVNGNIRWVYPKGQVKTVLEFYYASTWRAKLVKMGLKLLGGLRLDALLSHPLTIHSKSEDCLQKVPKDLNFEAFSLFLGTPGLERSVLIGLFTKNICDRFIKISMNSWSERNLNNEGQFLNKIKSKEWEYCKVPEVRAHLGDALVISKLSAKGQRVSHQFGMEHSKALLEISNSSRSLQRFDSSTFGELILDNCAVLRKKGNERTRLERWVLDGVKQIPNDLQFSATLAHGDFTPWNMFLADEKLFVYDWESAMDYAPALFDLFHFHFQTGIFLKKSSFQKIYAQIKFAIESNEDIRKDIERHGVNIKDYLNLYVLYIVSRTYALNCLSPEASVDHLKHRDAVWEEALSYLFPAQNSYRTGFIQDFHSCLNDLQHAFLKFNTGSLEALPNGSDLDIAIQKGDLNTAIEFCQKSPYVRRFRKVRKSFMTTLELFFHDNEYLSIDLIHDFKRKSKRFMVMESLLNEARNNSSGVRVPHLKHDAEYALSFYALNGADLPVKYLEFFTRKPMLEQLEALNYLKEKYQLQFSNFSSLISATSIFKTALVNSVSMQRKENRWKTAISFFKYLLDTLKERTSRKGFVVTFSGVDGVGKTTVIENVKLRLQEKYRKEVVLLRHRPKILPMLSAFKYGSEKKAEDKSDMGNPNAITKKSKFSSYVRFLYYYTDYFLGQFYVQFRYVLAGKIVLYDRYYFDLINHPERNNFVVNRRLVKWLYRPIIKPSLNIYLSAEPQEIFKRKRELNISEITNLSNQYVHLFKEYDKKKTLPRYVIHRNENLSETVRGILYDVQQIA